ncbi:hypothetical protein L1765_07640 [Microaerobacter geothermalis]|uniref:hypothetical protein n=1 Tax=Microaerobacter geothermalis TaxID=674972 RepID=UPI001F25EF13|nr:hypothetical protein [Microaerobacter geothermalis]MCF6093853.1 hypothetical protein [Microaerobacter geothermalis]
MSVKPSLFTSIVIMLTITSFIVGCNKQQEAVSETLMKNQIEEKPSGENSDQENQSLDLLLNNIDRVSVITKDGTEVPIEDQGFIKELSFSLKDLTPSSIEPTSFIYTVILWLSSDEPVVLQIGENGILMGEQFYQGKSVIYLQDYIHKWVGLNLVKSLPLDQMFLYSRDMNLSAPLVKSDMERIREVIQDAQYLEEKPAVKNPLYPYYVLELDIGGKEIIEVEVLNETLISVPTSNGYYYYQLTESISPVLKKALPSTEYQSDHIKSLFLSKGVRIKNLSGKTNGAAVELSSETMDPVYAQSIAHSLVRLLEQGTPAKLTENNKKALITFLLEDREVSVAIYDNFFIFNNQVFGTANIFEKIVKVVSE